MIFRDYKFRYQIYGYYINGAPIVNWCRQNLGPEGYRWLGNGTITYIKNTEDYVQFILSVDKDDYRITVDLES